MSIHDFHSKLTSEREEGRLFEVLRRLKGLESPNVLWLSDEATATWSVWTDSSANAAPAKA